MTIIGIDVLSFLIIAPALGALALLFVPSQPKFLAKYAALGISLVITAVSVSVFFAYNALGTGDFQMVVQVPWFELLGVSWHLGIDGISAAMILLTGILTPLAIIISFEVEDRTNVHMALILFFATGSYGVFAAKDLMIFFLFYELTLVPMYFLINQWGSPAGREYASKKFFIYSLGGSLGLLLAVQLIGWAVSTVPADIVESLRAVAPALETYVAGSPSFSIDVINALWPALTTQVGGLFLGVDVQVVKLLAFLGFFVAFGIKVPVWPFHTWLPDAHGEAPTAGSMLLAGVMLKLGAYGFLRLVIPFFPDVWVGDINILGFVTNFATIFAILSVLGIVLGAFSALGQNDIKRLVAYSSVNHMGFVAIGLAVTALTYGQMYMSGGTEYVQDAILATNGAVLQMFNHGLTSAGMFLLAGGIYHKTHTRDLTQYGGFWVKAPVFGAIFIFTSMASLGLPGLNGFVSEFLVVRGTWTVFTALTIISMLGLLFTGGYILKGIRAVLHGPFNLHWKDYKLELELRELIAIAPLLALILITGIAPNWILSVINASVTLILGTQS